MQTKIMILVVTYNRLEKLKKALSAYINQSYLPYKILIVDNCSTDGTRKYLSEWEEKTGSIEKKVICLERNCGGSGGFYEGMKAAKKEDFDWLWISDDDAYPDIDVLQQIKNYIEEYPQYDVFCSSVITSDGIDCAHRKVIRDKNNIFGIPVEKDAYALKHFDINIFSFVGTCISKRVLIQCGLPVRNFFIWFDDTEYSLRVNENFKMMCVTSIRVFHDTIIETEWRHSWKTYYGERNKFYMLEAHLKKKDLKKFILHYKLGMIKHFFTDHEYYLNQKDGYNDYRKNIVGISIEHYPGVYKYKKRN